MQKVLAFWRKNQSKIVLFIAVVLMVVLRFVPIGSTDFYSDNAINSFRAYGWFDYFGPSGQSGPFEWLGFIPWWANLSFQDAPPMAFFIQHIFFIFGSSTAVARFPFILAGIGSLILAYFFVRRLKDQATASVALTLYSVLSLSVYAGQAAFLEGIEEFFIAGSILFGAYYLFKDNGVKSGGSFGRKFLYIYLWSAFIAFAILTKYTALFLIPPAVIYLLIYRKNLRANWKPFLLAIFIFILLLLPIVIYNANIYSLRGHFDAALSSILGIHSNDFWIVSDRAPNLDLGHNLLGIFVDLKSDISLPLLILGLMSTLFCIYLAIKKGWRSFEAWVLVNLFFLILMFGLGGVANRFLSIINPIFVIITALGIVEGWRMFEELRWGTSHSFSKYFFVSVITLVFLFELFYAFNTNVLAKPIGNPGELYSDARFYSLGFNELDSYIRKNAIPLLPPKQSVISKADTAFTSEDFKGKSVIVFDDRINWFAQMWYMQKYFLINRWPYISTTFLLQGGANKITVQDLLAVSGKPLYFIYPIDDSVLDPVRSKDTRINGVGPSLASSLEKINATSTIITNLNGKSVFKVYKVDRL